MMNSQIMVFIFLRFEIKKKLFIGGKYTMDEPGSVLGDLVGSNLFAWVLVFLCLFKGLFYFFLFKQYFN